MKCYGALMGQAESVLQTAVNFPFNAQWKERSSNNIGSPMALKLIGWSRDWENQTGHFVNCIFSFSFLICEK